MYKAIKKQGTECGAEPNKLNKAGCGREYHSLWVTKPYSAHRPRGINVKKGLSLGLQRGFRSGGSRWPGPELSAGHSPGVGAKCPAEGR